MRLVPILIFSNFFSLGLAFDLCFVFNTCQNKQKSSGNSNRSPRQDAVAPQAIRLDQDWVQMQGSKTAYHVAHTSPGQTWFDAHLYCNRKGGFLAEPKATEEIRFLKDQLGRHTQALYWIGLRGVEDCRCRSGNIEFDALFDNYSLTGGRNGRVITSCPQGYIKSCSGRSTWRFAHSGDQMGAQDWGPVTKEPNGNFQENCVSLWGTHGYTWSDWLCTSTNDKNLRFKPLCQKSLDSPGASSSTVAPYREPKEITNPSEISNPRENTNCLEPGIAYIGKKRGSQSEKIKGVGRFEECQRQCLRRYWCHYWSWSQKRRAKVCRLFADLRNANFKREGEDVISGTTLRASCQAGLSAELPERIEPREERHCVEYGVKYVKGLNLALLRNVDTAERCRESCEGYNGCTEWSFNTGRRKACSLKGPGTGMALARKSKFISGSVRSHCKGQNLSKMQECECVEMEKGRKPSIDLGEILESDDDDDNYDDDEEEDDYIDLVGSGLIDVRLFTPGVQEGSDFEILACEEKEVRRCSLSSNQYTTKEVCANYNTIYQGAQELQRINNIQSADLCRSKCLWEVPNCKYWSWKGKSKRKRCFLFGDSKPFEKAWEKGVLSGSVKGECAKLAISQLADCECYVFQSLIDGPQRTDYGGIGQQQFDTGSGIMEYLCSYELGYECYSSGSIPVDRYDQSQTGISGRFG